MTEQKNTFWLTVSQPVCPALSGVNMEGRTGGNGHEKCLRVGKCVCVGGPLLWEACSLGEEYYIFVE